VRATSASIRNSTVSLQARTETSILEPPREKSSDSIFVNGNTGITLLMAENLRTEFVWKTFMKNAEAQRGLQRAGFKPV
jgi:hypothetical protein